MPRLLKVQFLLALSLSLLPAAALAGPRAAVTVTSVGDVDGASLRTAEVLVAEALARHGIGVVRDAALDAAASPDARRALLATRRIDRVYAVSLLPMGRKLLVRLSERAVAADRVTHSARLSASSLEELDVVLPRLVDAVVRRVAVEQTQRVDTVSDTEGKQFRKKAGELLFGGTVLVGSAVSTGLAGPLYGGEFNTAYEMPRARLTLDIGGMGADDVPGHFFSGIRAFYLLSTGSISPFFGGGMGFMLLSGGHRGDERWDSQAGVGLTASVGVELFRLHKVRLIAEVEGRFPLFGVERATFEGGDWSNPQTTMDWAPIAMFKLGLMFGRK